MTLRPYKSECRNVFALAGVTENSATFAPGWIIEKSPTFLGLFVEDLGGPSDSPEETIVVDLQRHDKDGGFTDVEIACGDRLRLIIEAKRGWILPEGGQLKTYAPRLEQWTRADRRTVSVSAASQDYASKRLPLRVSSFPVLHRSWVDIMRLACNARQKSTSFEEKLWLREFATHLEDYVSMQNPHDNRVYVVALSSAPMEEGSYTWIDVVEKDGSCFYPVGNRYPVMPPNYIGFRYNGELQAVHHVGEYMVVTSLEAFNPNWPEIYGDHFLYKLGPATKPDKPVKTGKLHPAGRVWCAIDTLLSGVCATISDARDLTEKRAQAEGASDD